MGSIKITETSRTGELSSTVEYEFSDFQDYVSWRNLQSSQIKNSLVDLFNSFGDVVGEESQAEIVDISVGKKPTKH